MTGTLRAAPVSPTPVVRPRAGRDTPLTLAELIDLEVQLAADADRDPRELSARDAAVGEQIWVEPVHFALASELQGRVNEILG